MGERDRSVAPPPPAPPWRQRAVLVAGLMALLVALLAIGPAEPTAEVGVRSLLAHHLEEGLSVLTPTYAPGLLGISMLALAAVFACRSLEPRIGPTAPLLVALLIFGSGCWALAWTAGASLVPLALAVAAFALAYGGGGADEQPTEIYRPLEGRRVGFLRWAAVGLLLAELVPTSPLLAALVIPAALSVPPERRRSSLPVLLGGFAIGVAAELAVQGTGLLSDPISLAAATISLDPQLIGRSLAHSLIGRNVGLVVGFAPLLLLLALGREAVARPGLIATGVALPLLAVLVLPFDHAGGWLSLSFVAVYGALWHLPLRAPRRWEWVVAILLCGLASWPLFVAPRVALADGGVRLAGSWPRRLLPYEASLRRLPNRGETVLGASGVRVRAVAGCRLLGDSGRFEMDGAGRATIWLAAPAELDTVALELGPGAPSSFEVAGAAAGRTVYRPDGRVGFELLLSEPLGRHRLWFDDQPLTAHLIEAKLPGWQGAEPLRFRLMAAPRP